MFTGIGTLANVVAILIGGAVGLLFKKGITEQINKNIQDAVGVAVIFVSITGVISASALVNAQGRLEIENILLLVVSLALGTFVGALLKLDERLDRFGEKVGARFARGGDAKAFSQGMVSASLIFCVGAMAIVGSIEDGMLGNPQTLFIKALLDGITAAVLAASMGAGVLLSSIPVGIYQGAITLAAVFAANFMPDALVLQLSTVGNAIILCIGLNLCGIKKFKVASMLPSVLVPILYTLIKLIGALI